LICSAKTKDQAMAAQDARAADVRGAPLTETSFSYVHWGAIIAGALAAAALAFVLHSFAIAIGLAVSSTAPTWRDASFALVALSVLYLVLAAIISYGVGGYVAGRLRSRLSGATPEEIEFRDGMHGAAAWALATLLTALIALGGAQALTRLAAPSSGSAGPSASVGGENIIAYDIDRLFRGVRSDVNMEYTRAEAGRILLTASSHRGVPPEDRTELVRLVSARTGLAPPEAERRVDEVTARARENIRRARKSAVILAFSTGAAALLGLAVAWFAAGEGGKHRDGTPPSLVLGRRRPLTRGQGKSA
jgi:hypothetical protein